MGLFSKKPAVITDEAKVNELLTRGVENLVPKELAFKKLRSGDRLRVYWGIDPTGTQIHLGHTLSLRKLKAFSDLGHEVILVIGSFTAMIGDPTGRDAQRAPLTKEQVEENFQDYKRQAQKVLDFSKIEIRKNGDWLSPLNFSEIIKLASNFTVQQMLKRDMFQRRIEEDKPISLHEFLYPLMVGYDSVVLDVDCELGGSDQEFNMLAGRHLQQAMGKRDKFVLTTKLLEGTDGRKMSKSFNNCVYLDDAPSDMYGKLMSVKDELLPVYFESATDMPMEEAAEILKGHPKDAKMRLAREIVTMYHSKAAAEKAEADWTNTFSEGGVPENIPTVPAGKLRDLVEGVSMSELRRLVEQGAVSSVISGNKIESIEVEIKNDTLRIGKHRFLKVE
ncbi:tyrosine--tRNA ligase [Candidatus Adlerbacteria bacterium RIFOXYC1_FULL_48_26]|uniref:Tyrosine--tRNA ligase n=1 Tax=Candidatus Adlerbacteria bacterium RIFOXYC1_FULL_48_26 TaxID=1797247 RepID=A0A1F4Y4D6_9BACT|nr:MAG: tyrosine--tRNA ligase [Candidatus Adlerbacteria bacterium RIFOXYC1_FULL_48_26]